MGRRARPATVVYLANAAKIGGGARVLMDLMLNLDREHYQPVVVAPSAGALTEWAAQAGIRAHVCPDGDWQSASGLVRRAAGLAGILVRERAAIAHAAAPTCYRALGLAARMTRTATVVHLGFPPEAGELERSFLAAPDAVIGCYEGQAADHAAEIRRIRKDCRVVGICNGIDLSRFSVDAPPDSELRQGASHVVAILGHISHVKGHPAFIEAAAEVAARFPHARFVVIGGETLQTGLRAELERRAAELGIGDRVRFLGFRRDVPQVLAACDLVVLPSLAEGFPLAVLEAMACGKPVIATPVGGVEEAVTNGMTGVLIPPGHIGALAAAMLRLLADPEQMRRLGDAGRRIMEQRFSVEVFAGGVQSLYAEILCGQAAVRQAGRQSFGLGRSAVE